MGGGTSRFEFQIEALQRHRSSPDSPGYWRNGARSVPDSEAASGWWAYSVPLDNEGRMKLPVDAFEVAAFKTAATVPTAQGIVTEGEDPSGASVSEAN